jgi:fatty acid desaturase
VFCGLSPYVLNSHFGIYTPADETVRYYVYIHFLCKYLDFVDTIIMILKHNWKQVHFLQLFHHSTIGIVWHWVLAIAPMTTSTWGFGALANSFIHFLMYLHYFVSSLGINNPFKSIMTGLQMTQFLICLGHSFIGMVYVPEMWVAAFIQMFYMTSMLALFYLYVYKKSDKKQIYHKENKKLVIHINGNDYDATDFKNNHPGGNIIEQYDISRVPDATDAFNTFHFHSQSAAKMLNALPIINSKPTIPNDLQIIIAKWKQSGLYESCIGQFAIWASVIFGITAAGYTLMSYGYPIIGGIVVGIGWTHCGFVQHHAAHLAMSGQPQYDFVVASLFESVLKGGSNRWWRNRHNKHHAMPNSIEHDGDLRTTPFFAWDEILVKKVPTMMLRYQHLLFIPMLALYVPVFFITTKLFVIRKKYWDEMGLICMHFYLSSYFFTNWSDFITFYCIGYAIQGVYLGGMFGLSHFALPRVNNDATDWTEWQLVSTCNWGVNSGVAAYISGFLNLQIEHHIVPQMPAENYKYIVDDMRAYAKSHNLPYIEFTFWQALYNMINGLKMTADKELKLRRNKMD